MKERLAVILAIVSLLAAVTYPVTSKFLACQTIFGNLKCHLVTRPQLFDNARVISTEFQYVSIDPYEHLHIRIPVGQAKRLVDGNILRSCLDDRQNCTDPIWLNSREVKAAAFIGNADYYTPTVFCTAHWREMTRDYPNYRDEICVDTYTGDVWYSYDEI